MSKLAQLRKSWDFEGSVPRCSTCVHFKHSHIKLTTNSNTVRVNHHCKLGGFTITANSICKNWMGKDGARLEEAK